MTMIGIIGGSGLYQMEGLQNGRWQAVTTPFGDPSDELYFAELEGQPIVFLPRHGRKHHVSPTDMNYRANIHAMKQVGVTQLISLSAVGSLKAELVPGTFVIADQFIDRTFARQKSFFGTGLVAHVSMAHPTCGRLNKIIQQIAKGLNLPHKLGGAYLVMEGPQFSTLAESNLYRSWGCDVIGMTNMPEAKLAREAELCYATIAMVTDYDCWHEEHGHVNVEAVLNVLYANADKAKSLVRTLIPHLKTHEGPCDKGCQAALDYAIVTSPEARNRAMVEKLKVIIGRL